VQKFAFIADVIHTREQSPEQRYNMYSEVFS